MKHLKRNRSVLRQELLKLSNEVSGFFVHEKRKDIPYRFALLMSQLGDLFHYLTHDQKINPEARSWGTREDEKLACGQAVMQAMMCVAICKLPLDSVIMRVLKKSTRNPIHEQGLHYNLDFLWWKETSTSVITKLHFATQNFVALQIKIDSSLQNQRQVAAHGLENLFAYIKNRGFTLSEVFLLGLQNQRERDWKKVTSAAISGRQLTGICGVPGQVTGIAYVVSRDHPIANFPSGHILVVDHAKPEYVDEIHRALGMVANNGGKTCHAVTICLPKNIVCIVGTKCATEVIQHGTAVTIDANQQRSVVTISE